MQLTHSSPPPLRKEMSFVEGGVGGEKLERLESFTFT